MNDTIFHSPFSTLKKTLLFIACTLFLIPSYFFFVPFHVHAQGSERELSISPPLTIRPAAMGEDIRMEFKIQNKSDQPLSIVPSVHSFTSDGISGRPVVDFDHPTTANVRIDSDSFQLNQAFTLDPTAVQSLVLSITPQSPLRQDLNLVFVLMASAPDLGTTTGATTAPSVAATIIIQADSGYSVLAPITIHSIEMPRVIDTYGSLTPTITVTNPNQTVLGVSGTVVVKSMWGDTNDVNAIFPDNILAQSSRQLRASHKEDSLNLPTDFHFAGPFLPGKYTLEVTTVTASGGSQTVTMFFYVLPLRIGILLGIGIIILFFLRLGLKRALHHVL